MHPPIHLILGTGPIGCWIARALIDRGHLVRALNRRGQRPALMPSTVEIVAADLAEPDAARGAARGASVVYQALNPPYPLWAQLFPMLQANALAAAKEAGARYVSIENLYMYDPALPMNEAAAFRPRSEKGHLRARLAEEVMAAHQRGDLAATALRSSDYYGPGVTLSAFGDRVFTPLLRGERAQLMGSATTPHSFAYIEDVGLAAALLGTRDEALGKAWFAPHAGARTQADMLTIAAKTLGTAARYTVVSPRLLRFVGLFNPGARAAVEMMYQFTEQFVVDDTRFETTFGLPPTPLVTGLARCVAWYRQRADAQR